MSDFKLEGAHALADQINEVVARYEALNTSIYEFLVRRSSSKFSSIRGKEPVYQLFIELSQIESMSEYQFNYLVRRLMQLSEQPLGSQRMKKYGGDGLGAGHAQSLLARLYGYEGYQDAETASKINNGQIRNLRFGEPALVLPQGVVQIRPAARVAAKGDKPTGRSKTSDMNMRNKIVKSQEGLRMGGLSAKDMAWFVRDYGSQFRTAWLIGNRGQLREFAVKRFYGLNYANELAPYLKLRVFPPAFHPDRILRAEQELSKHLGSRQLRDKNWTAVEAFEALRPWCATPEVEQRLLAIIGKLAGGKPQRYAQFIRRKYGVVALILDKDAGIGLITENDKIVDYSVLIRKEHKTKR